MTEGLWLAAELPCMARLSAFTTVAIPIRKAIFSRDVNRALAMAKRVESGICHINGPTVQDEPQMPFGGVKGSGVGRFGGSAGVHEFTDLRWITIETEQHYPF